VRHPPCLVADVVELQAPALDVPPALEIGLVVDAPDLEAVDGRPRLGGPPELEGHPRVVADERQPCRDQARPEVGRTGRSADEPSPRLVVTREEVHHLLDAPASRDGRQASPRRGIDRPELDTRPTQPDIVVLAQVAARPRCVPGKQLGEVLVEGGRERLGVARAQRGVAGHVAKYSGAHGRASRYRLSL
jgi:hypothetical protein